jgi:cell division protein FtsW
MMILTIFGILMVYNSSVAIAIRDFSDQYYFVREQFKWLIAGFIACWTLSRIDYRRWFNAALPLMIITLVLLLAVFVPGVGIRALGAQRWLNLGFITLQPSELAKFALVIYLSAWFAMKEKGRFAAFLILLLMLVGLVVMQPDVGTAVILFAIALFLYFFSGAPLTHVAFLFILSTLGFALLSVTSPYRFSRVLSFLNPEHDPLGASYQIRQVLLALGSGGLLGVGFGQSRQKFEYLPEANTDSIFAVIGEEIGFVGSFVVIVLFLMLIWRGYRIAKRAPDAFGRLLALGITTWIGIQTLTNLAAMVALIPLTGIPLPLISYGGSSLIIILSGLGILLNISRQS